MRSANICGVGHATRVRGPVWLVRLWGATYGWLWWKRHEGCFDHAYGKGASMPETMWDRVGYYVLAVANWLRGMRFDHLPRCRNCGRADPYHFEECPKRSSHA